MRDVLFPYARAHLGAFVRAHRDDPEVRAALTETAALTGGPLSEDAAIATLERWIDEDRKAPPLKALQGRIWEAAYANGDVRGHVYVDAVDALRSWHARGVRLAVYSSGSVSAQKLLFAHSIAGDLTPLFSAYYDTRTGAKTDVSSYAAIARDLGLDPDAILFLSDNPDELTAARGAGLAVAGVARPGEALIADPTTLAPIPVYADLAGVRLL